MDFFFPEINIKQEVQKLMRNADLAYEQQQEEERKRLEQQLQEESEREEKAMLEKLQQQQTERLRAKENALIALKQDKERQREEFLKAKTIQLKINNCEEIRTYIQQKHHEEAKRCQLAQIEEKMKLKQARKDEEKMWKEIHLRNYKKELERDTLELRARKIKEEKALLDIKEQIKERALKAEQERIELQEVRCNSLPFPDHDGKLIQLKKSDLAEKLRQQMETTRMLQKKRDEQEREVVRTLNEGMQRELERERKARDAEREILAKQINQYYQYSKHVEKQRLVEEAMMDKLIRDVRQQYDQVAVESCQMALRKRWGLADIVYDGQRKQIAEAEDRRRREREQELQEGIREREIYEQHRKASFEADNRMQLAVKQYRDTLKEQIVSAGLERERSKRHDQMLTNKLVEANAQELDFVQTYVKGSFDSHFKQHPNASLLKKK
uniref:(northern house mosquito) hypothetical protein n=1 Tax=Culex pipiens TaxID=7175 RepID=A0A8D8CAN0_CULPI